MTGKEHYFAAQSQDRSPRVLEAAYKQRLRKPGQRARAKENSTHAPWSPRGQLRRTHPHSPGQSQGPRETIKNRERGQAPRSLVVIVQRAVNRHCARAFSAGGNDGKGARHDPDFCGWVAKDFSVRLDEQRGVTGDPRGLGLKPLQAGIRDGSLDQDTKEE